MITPEAFRQRSCAGKISYVSRRHAKTELKRWEGVRRGPSIGRPEPYHCQHCDQWHLGHRPRAHNKLRHNRLVKDARG